MKKVLFTSLFMLLAVAAFSQKAVIKKEKGVFTQTENSTKTKFQLSATPEEMEQIKTACADLQDRMVFKSKSTGNNLYDCEMEITNTNTTAYVRKMFMSIGIKSIIFDGKPKTLDQLPGILTSLK